MSLSWLTQWVKNNFAPSHRKTRQSCFGQHPRRVRLGIEALEDRCLLSGGVRNTGLGLLDAGFVYDIVTQIHELTNPNVAHQQPLGYLFCDVGNLIGNVVSSIPGADTNTIGLAITTAADLGRLGWLIKSNHLLNTKASDALFDFRMARLHIEEAINQFSVGNNKGGYDEQRAAESADNAGAAALRSIEVTPATEPVTKALNDMLNLNTHDGNLAKTNPSAYYTDTPRFNQDEDKLASSLPWSAAAMTVALSDVLALAGDVSSLAGGPVGAIVGDALQTGVDALNVGVELATNEDPTSDLALLAGDGGLLMNDILAVTNPSSQPLSVATSLPSGSGSLQSGTIATFSDPKVAANQAAPPPSDYKAYISWGDGSSSMGQIAAGSGHATYLVTSNHLYTTAGNYSVSVVVAGNGAQGQGTENVTINANNGSTLQQSQGITVAGQNLTTQGKLTVSGPVATVYAPASDTSTAAIEWGDGSISTGQIVANSNGTFSVTGSHTYAQSSGFLTSVLVSDSNGNAASAFGSVTTASPTSSVNPLPAVEPSPSFTISWSGNDPGGPGIVSYDVYFSDNGGPWKIALTNTTLTSSTFTGHAGHSYRFCSVATDGLGISQPMPVAAQATTFVQLPAGGDGGSGSGGSGPHPQSPSPPPLQVPPFLAFLNSLLGGIETVSSNGTETITDRFFGIPLLVSMFNSSGKLESVTLFGINVTFRFESL